MKEINNIIAKLKKYFVDYQSFILYSLILFGLLLFFSSLPYINLILNEDNLIVFMLIVFWIISVILFQPSIKVSLTLAIIFCLPAYFFLLIGLISFAEITGNAIFVFFATGVLQMIVVYFRKQQTE